jgi:predicted HAD superfamily hydrolase
MEYSLVNVNSQQAAESLGFSLAGPLAVGIANWLLSESRTLGFETLYLCGRDSKLIYLYFKDFLKPSTLNVVYLETSRAAMFDSNGIKYQEYFEKISKPYVASAIFDLSWMGSALDFHSKTFPDRKWFGFNLHSINKSANAPYFKVDGLPLGRKAIKLYKMRDFFELLLTDHCPRTISYANGVPIRANHAKSKRSEAVESIHNGALKYMQRSTQGTQDAFLNSSEVLERVTEVWSRPDEDIKRLLGTLTVEGHTLSKKERLFTIHKWKDLRLNDPVVMPQASLKKGFLPLLLILQQNFFYFLSFLRFAKRRIIRNVIFLTINLKSRFRINDKKI